MKFLVLLAAVAQLALATPPACLLGALQQLPDPSDLKAACQTYQSSVTGNLTEVCSGDNISSAYSVYSSTCSANGIKVAALSTSSSGTATATGTATTAKTTSTAKTTAASSGSSSSTSTATGSAASQTSESKGMTTAPQPLLFVLSGLGATSLAGLLFL